mmetsp:Transcript_10568/g.15361  ORF Transcript_10568/g.15361 Transcript_10568/m.15361 type:complete len:159 (+) Transcript_10568:148-624(+)
MNHSEISNYTRSPATSDRKTDNFCTYGRPQMDSIEDSVFEKSLLLTSSQTERVCIKMSSLEKVTSSKENSFVTKHDLSTTILKNPQAYMDTKEPAKERIGSLFPYSNFVEMARPKNNGKMRVGTEYHIRKFLPCFENTMRETDIDDTDSEDEDDDEEE